MIKRNLWLSKRCIRGSFKYKMKVFEIHRYAVFLHSTAWHPLQCSGHPHYARGPIPSASADDPDSRTVCPFSFHSPSSFNAWPTSSSICQWNRLIFQPHLFSSSFEMLMYLASSFQHSLPMLSCPLGL